MCMAVISQRNSSLQHHWHRDAQENMIHHTVYDSKRSHHSVFSFLVFTERHYLGSEIEVLMRESLFFTSNMNFCCFFKG